MKIERTVQFKKDWKLVEKRGKDLSELCAALQILRDGQTLPAVYHDHTLLFGQYRGLHDAHIEPDWILLYKIQGEIVKLYRTGTHSDLRL